ncbi:hypothetical protein MVEN_01703800 [Mycena venus]|uniref:Uncharacterized protein n=1 Tax=Mycena venus TaxID=2733690 RepID=A0A8H6XPJ6_9AGAR|nr:hypothetical protein MVEN_01703800 [Mycena venus]
MTHSSPAAYLVLGIGTSILFSFLLFHLWSFDHFKCLRWKNGGNSRAFKRVMTYSYLLSVPLILIYALGFAVIKYRQGFIEYEDGMIPKPYILWPVEERRAIFPLMLTFSVGWGLGIISHLEELCFWLFLVNSMQQNWFSTRYFRIWVVGSSVALMYMPVLTVLTRSDPLKCEAYTFLGGSVSSLLLTLAFIPILWVFPRFLINLKKEGVNNETIIRLTKFHELNIIRTIFRFIFVVPFVILGADGVRAHAHVNESMLWTDFLVMMGSFGCCISSALTLVIFFPRSVEVEMMSKDGAHARKHRRPHGRLSSKYGPNNGPSVTDIQPYGFSPSQDGHFGSSIMAPELIHKERTCAGYRRVPEPPILEVPRWNQLPAEVAEVRSISSLSEGNFYLHRKPSNMNPQVHHFMSPIDIHTAEGPSVP